MDEYLGIILGLQDYASKMAMKISFGSLRDEVSVIRDDLGDLFGNKENYTVEKVVHYIKRLSDAAIQNDDVDGYDYLIWSAMNRYLDKNSKIKFQYEKNAFRKAKLNYLREV